MVKLVGEEALRQESGTAGCMAEVGLCCERLEPWAKESGQEAVGNYQQ